jgi:hypothetical protein
MTQNQEQVLSRQILLKKEIVLQYKLPMINDLKNGKKRVILWLRNDLRLHDNIILHWAATVSAMKQHDVEVLPVFCFDHRFINDWSPVY